MRYYFFDHVLQIVLAIVLSVLLIRVVFTASVTLVIFLIGYVAFYSWNTIVLIFDFIFGLEEDILCFEMESEALRLKLIWPTRYYHWYRFAESQNSDNKAWLIQPVTRCKDELEYSELQKGQNYRIKYGKNSKIITSISAITGGSLNISSDI